MLAFGQICARIQDSDWEVKFPYPGKMGPYAHKDKLWVGYDDEDMARTSAKMIGCTTIHRVGNYWAPCKAPGKTN